MSAAAQVELVELSGRTDHFWAPCRLRRSKRARRLSARVLAGGEIELVLPMRHSKNDGLAFLRKQGEWLEKQIARSVAPISFLDHLRNKPFLTIDGKKRNASVELEKRCKPSGSWQRTKDGDVTFALHPQRDLEKQAVLLVKNMAKSHLPVRLAVLGEKCGLLPKKVRVADQRSRWGSCSSSGTISLNWRLLLLDPALQDYVVHHELAHLAIMDHSQNYWKLLKTMDPKASHHDKMLNKISRRLLFVGRLSSS